MLLESVERLEAVVFSRRVIKTESRHLGDTCTVTSLCMSRHNQIIVIKWLTVMFLAATTSQTNKNFSNTPDN